MFSAVEWGILAFSILIIIALLLEPLSTRFHLPFNAVLVLIGFAGSEALVGAGIDLGLRWYHFRDLVLYILVPVLVFSAALEINIRQFFRQLYPIVVLSVPLFVLSVAIIGFLLYFGVGNDSTFPVIAAMVCAVLLAATDPATVIALLDKINAPTRMVMLLEGESLLNDATAIVLFGILISAVIMPDASQTISFVMIEFGRVLAGGILTGLVLGGFAGLLIRFFRQALHHTVISLAFAYLSFIVADSVFHVSGIMSVLAVGLTIAHFMQTRQSPNHQSAVDTVLPFWGVLKYIASALAFLLVGVTINLSFFTDLWWPILVGILAVLFARVLSVYLVLPVFTVLQPSNRLMARDKHILFGGGVRGAVTAALALSLPVEMEGWWIAQSIGYGVIIFSLFIQTPLLNLYLSRQKWNE